MTIALLASLVSAIQTTEIHWNKLGQTSHKTILGTGSKIKKKPCDNFLILFVK